MVPFWLKQVRSLQSVQSGTGSMLTTFFADAHVTVSAFGVCSVIGFAIVFVFFGMPLHRKRYMLTRILPGDAHGKSFKKRHACVG